MSYNWKCCSFYPNNFDASALLAYRLVSSTCEEVVYLDVFYFLYSHIVVELMNC